MNIQEIYALPVDKYGWRQLPNGNHIKLGNHVTLGDFVTLGDYVTLGNHVILGYGVILGDYVTLGDRVTLGNHVKLGDVVTLGDGVKLGDDVKLGDFVTLGDRVTDVIDLGYCEGYRKAIACVNGVAYIAAGCRWFTLGEALDHWKDRDDRKLTNALLLAAIEIAKIKNWSLHDITSCKRIAI